MTTLENSTAIYNPNSNYALGQATLTPTPNAKPRKKIRNLQPYDAKVLKFLKDNPGWHRLNDIADDVGYDIDGTSRSAFARRIDLMIDAGKILKKKDGSAVLFAIAKDNTPPVYEDDEFKVDGLLPSDAQAETPLFTFTYYADHVRLSYEDALKITQELAAGQ